ncbi:hypothetical protein Psuf_034040 [Phytohabitans suffuscus]|uniref:Uncharacterized protein n=1 Tax=Phytohabitans suffuscus TaxID=624315 RepID=A0A6F8YJG8_9ACTN|nr:hypothetical protein Psuf_034040 [Phytohabitans suffuscus]
MEVAVPRARRVTRGRPDRNRWPRAPGRTPLLIALDAVAASRVTVGSDLAVRYWDGFCVLGLKLHRPIGAGTNSQDGTAALGRLHPGWMPLPC